MRGQLLIPLLILQILKTFAIKPGNFIEWREKLSFFQEMNCRNVKKNATKNVQLTKEWQYVAAF